MAYQAMFASRPLTAVVNFSTANTNRDGTGTIATLVTGTDLGTRIDRVRLSATGTTTAGMVRFFIKESSGDTWRLTHEIQVSAVTPSATVATFSAEWAPTEGLVLKRGAMLGIATHNAEAFNAVALGGEF